MSTGKTTSGPTSTQANSIEKIAGNFEVGSIENIKSLLEKLQRLGEKGVNIDQEVKKLNDNKNTLSTGESQLLEEYKKAENIDEKMKLVKDLIENIRKQNDIQASLDERSEEMSVDEAMDALMSENDIFQDVTKMRDLNKEELLNFFAEHLQGYDMANFKKVNPDFGIMCIAEDLRTDTKVLDEYIKLNHKNIGFPEWRAIAKVNIDNWTIEKDYEKLKFFFNLNKEVPGALENTDKLFAEEILSQFREKHIKQEDVLTIYKTIYPLLNADIIENFPINNILESSDISDEAFQQSLQRLQSSNENEKQQGKRETYMYIDQVIYSGKDIYSALGKKNWEIIVANMDIAELPNLSRALSQMSEDTDDFNAVFNMFLEKRRYIITHIPNLNIEHIQRAFDGADKSDTQILYRIIRKKLAYMHFDDFGSAEISEFINIVENSKMTEVQKSDILSQSLFLNKLKTAKNDSFLSEKYKEYSEKRELFLAGQKAFKKSSDTSKNNIRNQEDQEKKEKMVALYNHIVEEFLEDLGIEKKDEVMKEIKPAIKKYLDDPHYNAIVLFKNIASKILSLDAEKSKISALKPKIKKFIEKIGQIKDKQFKKKGEVLEQGSKNLDKTHIPKEFIRGDTIMADKIFGDYKKHKSALESEAQKSLPKGQKVKEADLIELYFKDKKFEKLTPQQKQYLRKQLENEIGKQGAQTDIKMRSKIAGFAFGEISEENITMIRERVMYHGESVAVATHYADTVLGGPMGTVPVNPPPISSSQNSFASLSLGADPVPLNSIKNFKGVNGYTVQNQGDGMLQIANGDIKLEVSEDQAMAYISNISLMEQTGLGILVPNIQQINQIIAIKTGKQISTLDGKISKVEAKGLLTQFADILDMQNISQNDGVPEMIAKFRNNPHLQGATHISEKLIEKGIVSREGKFLENNFRQVIKGEPSQKTVV